MIPTTTSLNKLDQFRFSFHSWGWNIVLEHRQWEMKWGGRWVGGLVVWLVVGGLVVVGWLVGGWGGGLVGWGLVACCKKLFPISTLVGTALQLWALCCIAAKNLSSCYWGASIARDKIVLGMWPIILAIWVYKQNVQWVQRKEKVNNFRSSQ